MLWAYDKFQGYHQLSVFCHLYILFLELFWSQSEPVQTFTNKKKEKKKKELSSSTSWTSYAVWPWSQMDNTAHMMGAVQVEVQSDTDLLSSS